MKKKLLVIVGPTASGKSDLAVSLAKRFNGEVISADSRQVYKGLDIGTGKITRREMRGVQHHLLDVASPKSRFSAERYRALAHKAITGIASRGKLPIIVGGTGFYIDAVLDENAISNVPPDEKIRAKLSKKSSAQLLRILKKLDPKRWRTISKNPSDSKNARRIVRAIEIAEALRKRMVEGRQASTHQWRVETTSQRYAAEPTLRDQYAPFFIGIKLSPQELKKRIRARLLKRLKQGMISEARRLHKNGLSWKRMDELGLEYRYLAQFLQEKMGKEELVKKLNAEIWRYAKRQMVWFRKNKEIRWLKSGSEKAVSSIVREWRRS